MVTEIRIYVEGGGDSNSTKDSIRKGFNSFLSALVRCARIKGIRWQIIACGGRQRTFENYQTALLTHPTAFNVLLVDAEGAVATPPWQHLRKRDGWQQPPGTMDEHCHLMVQNMEAWLVADPDALERYYGPKFSRGALPHGANDEQVDKPTLTRSLTRSTRNTQKGEYRKIRHGADLLERIDPAVVRRAAPSCERLFATLATQMGGCP